MSGSRDAGTFSITEGRGGEIFLDTESREELFKRLNDFANDGHAVTEKERNTLHRAFTDYMEEVRSRPSPKPQSPPKPKKTVATPRPADVKPAVEDSPRELAAPDVKPPSVAEVPVVVARQLPEVPATRAACCEVHWSLSSPRPAEELASMVTPPPASEAERQALVQGIKRNEVLAESHPTHADPFSRTPAGAADPVDLFTGALLVSAVDLVVATPVMPVQLERRYRSGRPYFGPFGYGWDHNYNVYLRPIKHGAMAMWTGALREQTFEPDGAGWLPEIGLTAGLERIAGPPEVFEVTHSGGTKWRFERPAGWTSTERIPLASIVDRHGNFLELTYDGSDRVGSVLDGAGRGLVFQYGGCGLLEKVTDHTRSRVVRYEHHVEIEHLVRVILPATLEFPEGIATSYEYSLYAEHPAMRHNILRIADAKGRVYLENEYAGPEAEWSSNTVIRQRSGRFEYRFEYEQIQFVPHDELYLDVPATRTLVAPPDGSLHIYTFNYRGDLLDQRFRLKHDGSFRVVASQFSYDAAGNMSETVAADGLRRIFTYDSNNTDPCARRNLVRVELAAPLGVVPSRLLFKAQYEPRYQLVTRSEDETGAETRWVYDFDVNPVGATGRLLRIHLPAVVRADGVPQQSVLLFEHNTHGQLTGTVNPEGGRTELTYISGGRQDGFLSKVTVDAFTARLVSTFDYDGAGFLKRIAAPGGRIVGLTHNALGQLEESVAPTVGAQSARVRRWFDDSGSIVRVERPAGSSAAGLIQGNSIVDEYERDELGNVRRVTLAHNTVDRRQWLQSVDHAGRAVATWDPSGIRKDRVFGENGALLSETAAAGGSLAQKTAYTHDRAGRVRHIVGPMKDSTTFEYDVWGRPRQITLPSGAIRTLVWGANDRLIEERVEDKPPAGAATGVKGPLLQRQSYEYDRRGRPIATTQWSFRDVVAAPVLLKTRYVYDRDDNIRAILLPRGAQWQFKFDSIGRRTETIDPHGNVRQFIYDSSGDLTDLTLTEVENGVTRATTCMNTYDARGRLQNSGYLGTVAHFEYDDRDLPIEERASTGVTRHQYNAFGQVIENLIDPGGLALRSQFDYSLSGQLHRYVDPTGQSTTWERDALGRAVAIKPPDGTLWESVPDTTARKLEQRQPSGNRVVLEYAEDESRPIRIVCIPGPGHEAVAAHELVYDGMGRLVRASVGTEVLLRQYDSLSRLIEETARGQTVRMEYDDATGAADLVFPDRRRERTEHNAAGQPTRILLVTPGALGGSPGDVLLAIAYSTAGRPARVTYGNGVEAHMVYDDQGRVIRIEYQKAGGLLDSCRLRYDAGGHRAVVQYLGAPKRNLVHGFDAHGRVVEARSAFVLPPLADATLSVAHAADVNAAQIAAAAGSAVAFSLDGADVRMKVRRTGGAPDENYVSTPDHRVTAAGPRIISYSPDGTRTGDARYTYQLDALNRVRRVVDRASNAVVAEMRYDPLSRVASGTINGQEFERWFANATHIHEVSGPTRGTARQHSQHPLWPVPFCVVDAAGPAYVHQDEGWSTMCVTDTAGAVVERHRYDVFGASEAFAADGVTPLASLRTEPMWRAMPALGTTTLFRTPRRLYDPQIGMFTSPDPLLFMDSPSAYAYAAHNPVDFADPTGCAKSALGRGHSIDPPPPISGSNDSLLFQPDPSWFRYLDKRGHQEAQKASPDLHRVYEGMLASPFAFLEEVAIGIANIPHSVVNRGTHGGEHLGRSYVMLQQGEGAEALAEYYEAIANLAVAFLDLASIAQGLAGKQGTKSGKPGTSPALQRIDSTPGLTKDQIVEQDLDAWARQRGGVPQPSHYGNNQGPDRVYTFPNGRPLIVGEAKFKTGYEVGHLEKALGELRPGLTFGPQASFEYSFWQGIRMTTSKAASITPAVRRTGALILKSLPEHRRVLAIGNEFGGLDVWDLDFWEMYLW